MEKSLLILNLLLRKKPKCIYLFNFSFVDPTRMIAVSDVGGIKDGDIKQMIKDNKLLVEAEGIRVLESDNMYIKQAEHTLRTENFEAAGTYIMKALEQNPDSTVSLLLKI